MKNYLIIGFTVFAVLFTSCKKDDDDFNPNDPKGKSFSSLSTAEHKGNLEASGQDMLDLMADMQTATAMEVLNNLNALDFAPAQQIKSAQISLDLTEKVQGATYDDFLEFIRSNALTPKNGAGLIDDFNAAAGTYVYDFTFQRFAYTPGTGEIRIEFPGKATDATNTASLVMNNFSVMSISSPDEEIPDEVPVSLNITLSYNGAEVMKLVYTSSFTSDGIPTQLTATFTMDDFMFSMEVNHSPYSNINSKESFTYQNQIIIETFQEVNGNWSENNLSGSQEVAIQEIIHNANMYIQVMDVKLIGIVNVKGLVEGMNNAQSQPIETEFEAYQLLAQIINANAGLALIYADTEEKITEAEIVAKEYDDGYGGTYYDFGVVLVFADGSKVDAETYFSENFDALIQDYTDFLTELESNWNIPL